MRRFQLQKTAGRHQQGKVSRPVGGLFPEQDRAARLREDGEPPLIGELPVQLFLLKQSPAPRPSTRIIGLH